MFYLIYNIGFYFCYDFIIIISLYLYTWDAVHLSVWFYKIIMILLLTERTILAS